MNGIIMRSIVAVAFNSVNRLTNNDSTRGRITPGGRFRFRKMKLTGSRIGAFRKCSSQNAQQIWGKQKPNLI